MPNGIKVRIKDGHVMDGKGEGLGTDSTGKSHTFWRMYGEMEVPADLAIKLEMERPQRFEIVDRAFVDSLGIKKRATTVTKPVKKVVKKIEQPKPVAVPTPVPSPKVEPVKVPKQIPPKPKKEVPKPVKNVAAIKKPLDFKDIPPKDMTIENLENATKDKLNDFGAVNNIAVNTRDNKSTMIKKLVKGIQKIIGKKVKKSKFVVGED